MGCAGLAGVAWASPTLYPDAVTDADELAPFFEAAATGRVDIVGIGDSNQLQFGHGWDRGWILASHERFGTWATSLMSLGENTGNGAGMGEGWQTFSTASTGQFVYSGAPVPQDALLAQHPDFGPHNYLHVPEGAGATLTNHGVALSPGAPLDVNQRLRFSTVYAVADSVAPATIRPSVRRADAPYSILVDAPAPVPVTGPLDAVMTASVELPAQIRDHPVQSMLTRFNTTITGPLTAYYMRIDAPDVARGASFGTFYAMGSRSARDMSEALRAMPIDTLTLYFDTLRQQQGDEPRILVRINTGLNDRSETLPPVDAPTLPPSSPDAFEANLNALLDRLNEVWTVNGWPEDELYILITVSHPTGPQDGGPVGLNNDDLLLVQYRERAHAIAQSRPRCAAADLNRITSESEMVANLWYRSNLLDRFHLRSDGYYALADRELCALQSGRSWYDADGDGSIAPEDLYALESWVGTPPTDAPPDLSAQGLARAVRFGEAADALSHRE
ncbi:MAG: hypothetical protein Tsb0013_24710 [Phycisphaerales bacterium]